MSSGRLIRSALVVTTLTAVGGCAELFGIDADELSPRVDERNQSGATENGDRLDGGNDVDALDGGVHPGAANDADAGAATNANDADTGSGSVPGDVDSSISGDTITASSNPCIVARGQPNCSSTIEWTTSDPALTYQVAVRTDNGPWTLFDCTRANGDLPSHQKVADFIVPHHATTFALRSTASSDCSVLDPNATEIASVEVSGATALLAATPEVVLTLWTGSPQLDWPGWTQLDWTATYDLDGFEGYADSYALWVRVDDEVDNTEERRPLYRVLECRDDEGQGVSETTRFPIDGGHRYRFSLNLHSGGCETFPAGCSTSFGPCDPDGPEIAATIVTGVSDYLVATPDGVLPEDPSLQGITGTCSAPPGGTCDITLNWGTAQTDKKAQIWESDGSVWTPLPCSAETFATRTLVPGKTYTYELHLGDDCQAARTGTARVSTTAKAQTDFLVREGNGLKLGGRSHRALGMTKPDLFNQYWNGYEVEARKAIGDAAAQFLAPAVPADRFYLRVNGGSWGSTQLWRSEPAVYWSRFEEMLVDADSEGIQLIILLPDEFCGFTTAVEPPESLHTMFTKETSQSRQELFRYVRDLLEGCDSSCTDDGLCDATCEKLGCDPDCSNVPMRTANRRGYKNDARIQVWDLGASFDIYVDAHSSVGWDCSHMYASREDPTLQPMITTDEFVSFVRKYATYVKSHDPNHLVSLERTALRSYSAAHVRAWPWTPDLPEAPWAPLCAGQSSRWCPDDQNMMESLLEYLHPDPIDFVSMFFSNNGVYWNPVTGDDEPYNSIFGSLGTFNADLVSAYMHASRAARKPLYDTLQDCDGDVLGTDYCRTVDLRRNFTRAAIQKIVELHVPLSLRQTWEFGELPSGDLGNNFWPGLEPLTDEYLGFYALANAVLTSTSNGMNVTPENPGFEASAAYPDAWSVTDPSRVTLEEYFPDGTTPLFNNRAVKLSPQTTELSIESKTVELGTSIPSTAHTTVGVAAAIDGAVNAKVCILGYTDATGSGEPSMNCEAVVDEANKFKVHFVNIQGAFQSVRVRLVADGSGYALFDDVRVSVVY